MQASVSEGAPQAAAAQSLDTWLAQIGLSRGLTLGPWELSAAEVVRGDQNRGATVEFTNQRAGARVIRLQLLLKEPSRPAFARTASLDISHENVPDELLSVAPKLLRVVHAIVAAHDDGRLSAPEVPAEAAAAPPTDTKPEEPAPVAYSGAYAGASAREPDDDPALRVGGGEHFLDWRMLEIDDLVHFPDAINDIVHGRLGGMIIKGVFSADEMARVVARLEGNEVDFHRTYFPPQFKSHFLGRCLDGSDPELAEYLDQAARFIEDTRAAFAGCADFQTRMEEMFGRIAGGRTVTVPHFRNGRPYSPATVRVLPEGGQIGTHCGNEMGDRPAYTHLNTLVDRTDQVSYFVTMQAPEAGGELIVYSLKLSDVDQSHMLNDRTNVDDLLPISRWEAYSPGPGDLLIFDGGRYLHRVSVVRGPRTRWTIGGFLMIARDGQTTYYWS